ncbi:MAG: GNAT family N-acetyltransferase [Clostridia bacterium]|nr:GNAT family N-acetyltransferase [Clostridia bacterium]
MKFAPKSFKDKNGEEFVLRNAEADDAADLLKYLRETASQTPYLVSEPEEITLTEEQEKEYIQKLNDSERDLMLVAYAGGRHIGNCSLRGSERLRYRHRGRVGIALYEEFCGRGIGKIMLEAVLGVAAQTGYEQAELEVVAGNERAIALYEKLGFKIYGTLPDNMKYKDGTYADSHWMMKKLNR